MFNISTSNIQQLQHETNTTSMSHSPHLFEVFLQGIHGLVEHLMTNPGERQRFLPAAKVHRRQLPLEKP